MYSKIVLDALVESSSDTDISRMVVVINEYAPYRDYADLHKHNPDWWESLAEKVYTSSVFPKMALAPYLIAASQHLSEIKDKEDVEKKVVPLVGKAMAIDEGNDSVQQLAKIVMGVRVGAIEIPSLEEMRKNVLPPLKRKIQELDEKLTYKEE